MASNKIQVDISRSIMRELFNLVGVELSEVVTDEDIIKLIKTLKNIKEGIQKFKEEETSTKPANNTTILVVDDLGLIVYQLSILLTKNGYNVSLARSEPEAYQTFNERGPFDYVLMDLFMPRKEDGTTLLRKVKQKIADENLSTQVIVMSATKDAEAIEETLTLGADAFLEKGPDWKKELLEILQPE